MRSRAIRMLEAVAFSVLLALPLAAATKSSTTKAKQQAWPAENLTGTIESVDPVQHLVIVKADGVPYDMVIGQSTRIKSGDQNLKLGDLSSDVNKSVSVRFVPEARGDVARSIQLQG